MRNFLVRSINVASSDSCLHHCAVRQKVLSLLLCCFGSKYTEYRLIFCSSEQYKTLTPPHSFADELTTNSISQQLFISTPTINFRTCCSAQNMLQYKKHVAVHKTCCSAQDMLQCTKHVAVHKTCCSTQISLHVLTTSLHYRYH